MRIAGSVNVAGDSGVAFLGGMVHPGFVSEPTRGPRPAQQPRPAAVTNPVRPTAAVVKHPSRPPPPLPAKSPPAPPVAPRAPSDAEPSEEGWSDATTMERRAVSLSDEMRADVRAIAKAAVEEAVAPLARTIQDLTAALERERRERAEGDARSLATGAVSAKKTTLPGIPDPAAPPPVPVAAPKATPPPPSVDAPVVSAELLSAMTPTAPRVVTTTAPPIVPRDLVIDSSPLMMDLPGVLDGARRRRRLGWFVAFVLLAIVGAAVVSMLISQSQPR